MIREHVRLDAELSIDEVKLLQVALARRVACHKLGIDSSRGTNVEFWFWRQQPAASAAVVREEVERLIAARSVVRPNRTTDAALADQGAEAWHERRFGAAFAPNAAPRYSVERLFSDRHVVHLGAKEGLGFGDAFTQAVERIDRHLRLSFAALEVHALRAYSPFLSRPCIDDYAQGPSYAEDLFWLSRHGSDRVDTALQNAPCLKIYIEHRQRTLDKLARFTVKGPSFRFERKPSNVLERLPCFTQREFVYLGSPADVCAARESAMVCAAKALGQLELSGTVAFANDPFFVSGDERRDADTPRRMKLELRVNTPGTQKTLSVASFDLHGGHFASAFGFRMQSEQRAWSGCLGFGLERLAYCTILKFGPNPSDWPDAIRAEAAC